MATLKIYNIDNDIILDDAADDILALSQLLDLYLEAHNLTEIITDLKASPVYVIGNLKRDDVVVGRYELNT